MATQGWVQKGQIASNDFQREVLPNMIASLPAGEFVSVEMEGLSQTSTTGVAVVLDRDCGVDHLIHNPDTGLTTTVAARVSYKTEPAYASFTIGELELTKRRRELQTQEAIGPYFTIQGTVTQPETGTFVCGAAVATSDLITFVTDFPGLVETRTNWTNGRPFYVVWATDLWDQGFRVDVKIAPDAGRILGCP